MVYRRQGSCAPEGGSPPRPCGSGGRVPVPRRGRRSRRPHFFQQRKKWGKERRQKPMVFGFPSGRFRCDRKRHLRESATSLPALPLTWWSQEIGGSTDLSNYQIAHLPPLAASAGAAPWAADFLYWENIAPPRGAWERPRGQKYRRFVVGPFCAVIASGRKEFQRPWVFGGVLFHISFAVERNMAAGGIKKKN